MNTNDHQDWLDKPANQRKVRAALYVACALLFLLDFLVKRKVYVAAEQLPGFHAIFGFVACVVLVLIAKQMRKVLMRGEDYYDVER